MARVGGSAQAGPRHENPLNGSCLADLAEAEYPPGTLSIFSQGPEMQFEYGGYGCGYMYLECTPIAGSV